MSEVSRTKENDLTMSSNQEETSRQSLLLVSTFQKSETSFENEKQTNPHLTLVNEKKNSASLDKSQTSKLSNSHLLNDQTTALFKKQIKSSSMMTKVLESLRRSHSRNSQIFKNESGSFKNLKKRDKLKKRLIS